MTKKSIVIIQRTQFGYLTDTYKLSEHILNDFDINVICFDIGMPKKHLDGIEVIYVNRYGGVIARAFKFLFICIKNILSRKESKIFVVYFPLCFILSLFKNKNTILDFRTGNVQKNRIVRLVMNGLSGFESRFYSRTTVVSHGLKEILKLSDKKCKILPLGASTISSLKKNFDTPKLFYIGVIKNRNIHHTLEGVRQFIDMYPCYKSTLTYDIVGGDADEVKLLKKIADELNISSNINIHGYLNHEQAKVFFDQCNIGVSYIPTFDYYDKQPPTKTYEYILSGIPTIATSTSENVKLITKDNGVLCNDNPVDFAQSIVECINNFDAYQDDAIRFTLKDYLWSNIALNFKSILDDISYNE
ncbi:glycosyltransferase [Cobetia marina]|uniref:Glycosyltransferase n=1 Tax=Cobetia marina TaxID=28258 RepID=A0ABU9GBM0_COBMA